MTQTREERRADREEDHHGRERIAWEAQHEATVRQLGQNAGMSRTHRNSINQQAATQLRNGPTEVVRPRTAGTPGGDDDVGGWRVRRQLTFLKAESHSS
ncbi:hypothetical protein AHiyo8_22700 [Arthrobacter sp. Hiyo8]|nr:hypothetical protein AHiyo8_22700 [Arthrobacter sp. Hiyo8]